MAKSVKLLLTESVDNLGIVGDVVNVRLGYARNYLLPRQMATTPSEEAIKALAEKRAQAERDLAALRAQRASMIERLDGHEITLERSCNDQGVLYGGVTQHDLAEALNAEGFHVRPRDIRLPHSIKRLDTYEIQVKFDADMEASIKLWVVPDRRLEEEERVEMEFDDEGNLISPIPVPSQPGEQPAEEAEATPAAPPAETGAPGA